MSTISSGVGLISGLPIQELVDALIDTQRRPIVQFQNRLEVFSGRRTALLQVSAQLLAVRNTITRLAVPSFFDSATATTSNDSAALASATTAATPGEYQFTVRRLAASHQLISNGFASLNQPLLQSGILTIESAVGRVNRSTDLSRLNGGTGAAAGRIEIADRAGNRQVVDLIEARTIDDVVSAINGAAGISVRARIEGDRLVLQDLSGGAGPLSVAEVGRGRTAADLGLLQSVDAAELLGGNLIAVSEETLLSQLNDGNGIRTRDGLDDLEILLADGSTFRVNLSSALRDDVPLALLNRGTGVPAGTIRITDRSGGTADIDLSGAATILDVRNAINNASNIDVDAALLGGSLVLTDVSVGTNQRPVGELTIEDVDSTTAVALGIAGSTGGSKLTGKPIYSVDTIGDVLRVIRLHPANAGKLEADISGDGLGITLTDTTGGAGSLTVTAINDSRALEDLGLPVASTGNFLASRRLVAELNTVLLRSLNGGRGVDLSDLQIQDRSSVAPTSIDLSGVETLADLIDAINAAPTSIVASISASGLGIELTDQSGGTGNLVISGATADTLNIAVNSASTDVSSGNLQRRYISEASLLADVGVPRGRFRITDGNGVSAVVDLTQGDERTLQDVIDEINSRPTDITARINDTGDGLILEETSGGPGRLSVAEEGGTVARALGILGQANEGEAFLDGSFESRIEIAASDGLSALLDKIKESGANVSASIINDGSAGRPFRLSLTSTQTGRVGELAIDGGATELQFDVLAAARDATIVFGDADGPSPLTVHASSNTISNVIDGVRLDLVAASPEPVTVTVERDVDKIVETVREFVNNFNTVMQTLDIHTRFNPETSDRSVLQGDATARRIRDVLIGLTSRTVPGVSRAFNRLGSVGITLGSGNQLALDEERLREVLTEDPEGVTELLAREETNGQGEKLQIGLAGLIDKEISRLTETDIGIISLRESALSSSEDQLRDRIERLEELLDRRRARLVEQFNNMEAVLARLQSQQSALGALSTLSLNSRA